MPDIDIDVPPTSAAQLSDAESEKLVATLVEGILTRMGYSPSVTSKLLPPATGESDAGIWVSVECPEAERLLDYRNEGLDALQMLVQIMLGHRVKSHLRITLDLNGVREEHQQKLAKMAERIAERVQQTGRAIMLEPMLASERRIIHMTLRENPIVMTESTGEGGTRRVVIKPKSSA